MFYNEVMTKQTLRQNKQVNDMNAKALKTLEYDKIIDQLASFAGSPPG